MDGYAAIVRIDDDSVESGSEEEAGRPPTSLWACELVDRVCYTRSKTWADGAFEEIVLVPRSDEPTLRFQRLEAAMAEYTLCKVVWSVELSMRQLGSVVARLSIPRHGSSYWWRFLDLYKLLGVDMRTIAYSRESRWVESGSSRFGYG